ncbi:N-formylglutamate deformylase [Sulfitobacter mediterraneus]|uniref:N-formylglutamate deformylase n=1 Tax=Sulfitobacter mediterraneus TaxID=83219 RepID=UPI0021A69A91|nr:N-formylglutamate deformylase [Sulfitobacter mediterraneus]UWR10341.1 N-formylglutamate deformylase [Sulfitobacter mediterraneus]
MIEITQGGSPIVLGMPHTGTEVPPEIWDKLNERGQALADTDWHIDRLYNGLGLDVTVVRTPIHRYVIDPNRGPDDASLYPGQNTTGLCPLTDFEGFPIYHDGQEPDAEEVEQRRKAYHAPYHDALSTELARVKAKHGIALLYDCHSIRSVIPYLFDDTLPDLNIGTNSSTSCGQFVERAVETRCRAAQDYSSVLNGRFKGGWTTRHYGQPAENIHAIQMELAQSTYMDETPPWQWRADKAERLRPVLYRILNDLTELLYERQQR